MLGAEVSQREIVRGGRREEIKKLMKGWGRKGERPRPTEEHGGMEG